MQSLRRIVARFASGWLGAMTAPSFPTARASTFRLLSLVKSNPIPRSASPVATPNRAFAASAMSFVHEPYAVAKGCEPLSRQGERLLIPIDADQDELGETGQERLGVTAETQCRIDKHGAGRRQRRRKQFDRAGEKHRGV